MAAQGILARLGIAITANSAELKKGLDDATKEVKKFNSNVAKANKDAAQAAKELSSTMAMAAGVIAGVGAGILKAFSYADQISDTAAAFDVTVASLLKMQGALQVSGGSAENLDKILGKLSVNAEKAKDGSDDVRDAFAKLKISGQDIEGLGSDELFARIAYQLSQIEKPMERNALAFELLGKAAKGVDWKSYWENYASGTDATTAVSIAIGEAGKAWDNLGRLARAAMAGVLVLLTPLSAIINQIADTIDRIKGGQGGDIDWGAAMGGEPGQEGGTIRYGATSKPTVMKPPTLGGKGFTKGAKSGEGMASETEAIKQQTLELQRQSKVFQDKLGYQNISYNLTKNEKEMTDQVLKIEEERSKLLQNVNKEIEVEGKKAKVNTSKIDALKEQINVINQTKDAELVASVETTAARQAEQQSFAWGWENAFRKFEEQSQDAGQRGAEAFGTVIGEMNKGIDMFVDHGILGFSQFAESVIKDLIKIELKMQASQLLRMGLKGLFGAIGGGGGFENEAGGMELSGSLGFASGGNPPVGIPSMVGENGPELFIPTQPGTIIPNQQLSSVMGGGGGGVTYNGPYIANMQAIDTQSATQFLAKNKLAVWSANNSASRGMPTSR